jgi:hypothetical protein
MVVVVVVGGGKRRRRRRTRRTRRSLHTLAKVAHAKVGGIRVARQS